MITKRILAAAITMAFVAFPALGQTNSATETNGHQYSGGPKTEVSHHMGKKETGSVATKSKSGSHRYTGGPAVGIPHGADGKQ